MEEHDAPVENQAAQEPIIEEPTTEEESSTPTTMEALLEQEDLGIEFPRQGEIREGVIVSVSNDQVLVSIGAKSEGIIPGRELEQIDPDTRAEFEIGQEIPVYVINPENQQGSLLLSYTRAMEESDWHEAQALLDSGDVFEGEIDGYNKGGLIVNLGRLRGFVPGSQISLSRRMAYGGSTPDQRWGKMVGEPIAARVIEVDRDRRRLILSERAALQEARELLKERLLDELEKGEVRDGRVTSLANFGAFVNINGADGLVHITEISWERINHPSEVLKVGQEVKVKVIDIDRDRKRIGLSIRQLLADPWPQKVSSIRVGQLVEGKIMRLVKFGAFARLDKFDVEGLIHISELSDQRVEHPKEVLHEGEELTLRVINIDPERHRVGLSLRKVDSPAYAELDLEMALLEEEREEAPEEEPVAEAVQEEGEEITPAELETDEVTEELPVSEAPETVESLEETEEPAAEIDIPEASEPAEAVEAEVPSVEEPEASEPAEAAEAELPTVEEPESSEPAEAAEAEVPTVEEPEASELAEAAEAELPTVEEPEASELAEVVEAEVPSVEEPEASEPAEAVEAEVPSVEEPEASEPAEAAEAELPTVEEPEASELPDAEAAEELEEIEAEAPGEEPTAEETAPEPEASGEAETASEVPPAEEEPVSPTEESAEESSESAEEEPTE